jgi:hypothetical protein
VIPIDFCWRWPSVALFLGGITIVLLDGLPWRLALSGQTRAKAERSEDDRLSAQIR